MKPIPITPQTLKVAGNIIWFEPPEQALADPVRFMAYAMTYALPEDMRLIRQYVSLLLRISTVGSTAYVAGYSFQ